MAGSNAVDPNQLLKALSTLLSKEGGIKGVAEVSKLLILMKSARKMVSRCIYINILTATKKREIQEKFIERGGWELLNSWLHDAKSSEENPVIIELIRVFKELPVTIDTLKKNNTAKIIKSFSKIEGEDVTELKSMADDLVTTWMAVIHSANIAAKDKEKEKSPSVKKKKKPIKKVVKSTAGQDGDADDESDEPLSKRLRLGSIGSEPMDVSDAPGAHKSGESPKGKHGINSKHAGLKAATGARKSSSEDVVKKGEEVKKEEETKTKRTAKIARPAHTKFRSTGLEKDANLPPPKKKKTTIQPLPAIPEKRVPPLTIKKDGPLFSKSLSPIDKKPKPEDHHLERKHKPHPEDDKRMKPHPDDHSKSSTPPGGYGKIKLIPAKPKLQESSGFLDALNAPSLAIKKKIPKKVGRQNSTGSIKTKSPTPPEDVKVEPPKFSFYSSNQVPEEQKKDDSPPTGTPPEEGKEEVKEEGDIGEDWNEERPITIGKSNLKYGPSKNKKQVRWKEETDLVDVCYFVLDETERVNVNRVKDFHDAMANEKLMEKQNIRSAMHQGKGEEDKLNGNSTIEYMKWHKPSLMEVPPILVEYGVNSTERDLQMKREQTVLQVIFFDLMHLPFTPKEPDPETKKAEHTKIIPTEDESSGEHTEEQFHADHPDLFGHHYPMHGHEELPPPMVHPPVGPGHGVPHGTPPHSAPHMGHHTGPHGGPHGGPHPPPHGAPHPHPPPHGAHHGLPPGVPRNGPHSHSGAHPGALGTPQQKKPGPGGPQQGNTPPSPNTTIKNVQNLLASLSEGEAKPGSDLLKKENLDKLKEMLEPFKNQNPDNPPIEGRNMPPFPPQGPGNFGPGDFGPGDFGPRGPPHEPGGPFPMGPGGPMGLMGHGPRGPGPRPRFDGPGMEGPGGYGPGPGFGPGPNFSGPGRGMGPPMRGRGGYPPDMGRGGFPHDMGPRGGWRGRGGGGGRGRGGKKVVCYHYGTERGCLRGENCHFMHPPKTSSPNT